MPSGFRPRLAASASLITTQAEAPSESWLALPAVIHLSGPATGFSLARPSRLVSGRLPSSLVSVTVFFDTSLVFLSVDQHRGLHRHDLVVELAGLLARRGALLALQRILVLRLAADLVALGHRVGGRDHGV